MELPQCNNNLTTNRHPPKSKNQKLKHQNRKAWRNLITLRLLLLMHQCRYIDLNHKNLKPKPRHRKLRLIVLQQLTTRPLLLFVPHLLLTIPQHHNNKKAKEREKVKDSNAQLHQSIIDLPRRCILLGPPTHQRRKWRRLLKPPCICT